jgi:hypothetical protein
LNRNDAPLCFLHLPKSAGTCVRAALEATLPDGALAPRRADSSPFCDFDAFDRLDEPARSLVAVGDSEIKALGAFPYVSGHFSLPTLLRVAPASNIATVLREPRARLLSAFLFLRLSPLVEFWGPYGSGVLADAARSLEGCLSDPRYARATDNQVCRLVLHGDPRLEDGGFLAPHDVEDVAKAATMRLDQLGCVQVLERGSLWPDLSRFFGVLLAPARANVTDVSQAPEGALPIPGFDMATVLELIEQRTAADRLVYDVLLERRCEDPRDPPRIADAAFASQLIRFGRLTAV